MGKKNKQKTKKNWMVGLLLLAMIAFIGGQIPWDKISSNENKTSRNNSSNQPAKSNKKSTLDKAFNPVTSVQIIKKANNDSIKVDVELALNEKDIAMGLMHRKSMPDHGGMLFVMPEEKIQSFWMRNCYISLDMIFIDSAKKIVSVGKNTVPLSDKQILSEVPAKYVLEVNAGFADAYALTKGDLVDFNLK